MANEDLNELEKMVAACTNGGEGWRYGDSAPDGGFATQEELVGELLGVAAKTVSATPGDHTRHLWTIHMPDPLDASASLIVGHTGNGPTSEAHARLLSCAPAAISALVGEVRRLRTFVEALRSELVTRDERDRGGTVTRDLDLDELLARVRGGVEIEDAAIEYIEHVTGPLADPASALTRLRECVGR